MPLPEPAARPRLYTFGLLAIFLVLDLAMLGVFVAGADWAPVWVAGDLARSDPAALYDFAQVTALQAPLTGGAINRPFIYPPTALLLFTPLAMLPFYVSWALVGVAASAALAAVGRRMGANPILLLAAPPVLLCLIAGQPSLLIAALIVGGCVALDRRPALAGVLWGVAAAIKPTLLILAPLALIAGGHWRTLLWSGATGLGLAASSVLWLGLQPWWDWLDALPRFNALFASFDPLVLNAVTPYALALRLGIEGIWVLLLGAAITVPSVVIAFQRSKDPALRSVALIGGALLTAPYSMNYELAALAPAVLARRLDSLRDIALPLIWAGSMLLAASLVGLLAVYGCAIASVLNQPRMQRRVDVPA